MERAWKQRLRMGATVLLLMTAGIGTVFGAAFNGDTLILQVTDSSRAAIPLTKVSVFGAGGQLISTGRTDGSGVISIGHLASGAYDLLIECAGFAPEKRHILLSGSPTTLIVSLVPARVSSAVTVTDDGYMIETASSATRTELPVRDLPIDIGVVGRQLMDDKGVIEVKDALENTSGVYPSYARGDNVNLFNIRGFQQTEVYRDGIRDNQYYNMSETADLEDIEVLKGPASILYGQVEPGGLVNLITKEPQSRASGMVQFQEGSFGLVRPSVDFTGPFTPGGSLRYRINSAYENSDSFRDYSFVDRDFVAPSISYDFRDKTHVRIDFDWLKDHSAYDYGSPGYGDRPYPEAVSFSEGGPGTRVDEKQIRGGARLSHQFTPNLSLHESFSGLSTKNVENVYSPVAIEADGKTLDRIAARLLYSFQAYSLQNDVHYSFRTGPLAHRLLAGGDWFHRLAPPLSYGVAPATSLDLKNPIYAPFPVIPAAFIIPFARDLENSGGPYIQDLIAVTSRLEVLAALRYTDYAERTESAFAATQYTDSHAFSPQVGLLYHLANPVSLYGSWAKSFVPVSGTSLSGNGFRPEIGQQFEGGLKSELLRGRLSGTLSVYRINLTNVLIPDPANVLFSVSGGKQRSQGVELDMTGKLTSNWNVNFNYAFLQANVIGAGEGTYIPVGTPLANDPRHGVNLWTVYNLNRGPLKNLSFGGGVLGQSYRYSSLGALGEVSSANPLPNVVLPGFARVDVNASYGIMVHDRLRYKFQMNLNNLLDRRYYEVGSPDGSIPGSPRAANGTLRIFF
jgi:iron complex outermembrane receptor protein